MWFIRVLAVVVAITATAFSAYAEDWTVTAVRQPAAVAGADGAWVALEIGTTLRNGSWVRTGRRGRLMLEWGDDVIQIRPNAVASVSVSIEDGRPLVSVRQKFGSLLFDVGPAGAGLFRVETPFLGAVVKGTRFEISVNRIQVRMTVERGVVETTDIGQGFQVDVQAGQSVVLDTRTPESLVLTGPGPRAEIVKVPAAAALVAPAVTPLEATESAPLRDAAPLDPAITLPRVQVGGALENGAPPNRNGSAVAIDPTDGLPAVDGTQPLPDPTLPDIDLDLGGAPTTAIEGVLDELEN